MDCSVRENLDKILLSSFGVKEGQQVPSILQGDLQVKIDLLENHFNNLYDFNKPIANIVEGKLVYNHTNLNELQDAIEQFEEDFSIDYDNRLTGFNELSEAFDVLDEEENTEKETDHFINPHEMEVSSGSRVRHAPVINPLQITPGTASVNFVEWKEEREKLLSSLRQLHTKLIKEGYKNNSEKINSLNIVIQNVENDLLKIDPKDPLVIFSSVAKEVSALEDILLSAAFNPVNASIDFEVNKLRDRISSLNTFFTGKDILGTPIDITDGSNSATLLYEKVKDFFDEDKYNALSKSIEELTILYETKLKDIIKGVIESNELVAENIKNNKDWTTKTYILKPKENKYQLVEDPSGMPILDLLKDYLDKDLKGDVNLFSSTLGAATGGGILGDILHNIKSNLLNNEIASTLELKNKVSEDWKKVKDRMDTDSSGNKDFAYKKLFRKDVNGIRMNQLTSAYSDDFFKDHSDVYTARSAFYKNPTDDAFYADWMIFEKNSTTKIDPRKLSIAKNKYQGTSYERYFADDASILAYENQLRDFLGDTLFEIETNKALEKLNNYYEQQLNGSFSYIQESTLNPFDFLDHYNSSSFDSRDKYGNFLKPDYVHSIPNITKSNYKNKEYYDNINNDTDLNEVWKDLYQMLEYTNPFLKSEGIQVGMLELPQYEDLLDRELVKDLSIFGKVNRFVLNIWDKIQGSYFDPWFDRKSRERDETQQGENINLYYNTSAKLAKIEMTKNLSNLSFEELYKRFEKEGLKTNIKIDSSDNKATVRRKKSLLASSLAQHEINKNTSSNIVDSTLKLLDVVNNAKARQNTLGVFNLFLDFTRKAKLRGNSYVHDYLNNWGQTNIVKTKYYDSANILGIGETWLTKKRLGLKKYNQNEKEFIKIIKDLRSQERLEFNGINIGTKENPIYLEGLPGSYTLTEAGVTKSITEEEGRKLYEDYLNKKLDAMGVTLTVGSVFQGIASNITRTILAISFKGGITNREVGHLANLKLAASGRYGYTENNLHNARKFLLGTNALKYWQMAKKSAIGEKYDNKFTLRKSQDVETVKLFVESLHMIQNKADELALENRFGNSPVSVFVNNLKSLTFDANINNPEWHNQTEVILAVLNNTMVTNIDGVEKPFFDGKTTIFKPGTLELKEEFDTPENRRMWIDFKYDSTGKNDHVTAIAKISKAKEATQGNYNPEDVMPLQSTLIGKLGTIFLKYLPENTFQNWGYKKVDLRSGLIDYKGSKLVLAEHTPTLALYLGAVNSTRVGGAIATAATLGVTLPLGIILPQVVGAGIAIYLTRKVIAKNLSFSKKELMLALDFAQEVAKRSVNTLSRRLSGGYVGLPKSLMEKNFIVEQENLTADERRILSESAQEVANKFLTYSTFFISALVLKGAYLLFMMGSDDDDEERLHKLKDIEGSLNALQNIRENINSDIERFSNPALFADSFMGNVFLSNTIGWASDILKTYDQYNRGTKNEGDVAFQLMKNPFSPIPRNVSKTLLTDQSVAAFYEDPRVWRKPGEPSKDFIGDKFVREQGYNKEEVAEKTYIKERNTLRAKAKEKIATKLRKSGDYENYEIESKTKEYTDKFMKQYKKSKSQKYSTLEEKFNLTDEYKKLMKYLDEVK